jgi:hypothetical protein
MSRRNVAMASRRAVADACRSSGLIGITAAKDSSRAMISAAALRKASPRFLGMVEMKASANTRSRKSSAVGSGSSVLSRGSEARTNVIRGSADEPNLKYAVRRHHNFPASRFAACVAGLV